MYRSRGHLSPLMVMSLHKKQRESRERRKMLKWESRLEEAALFDKRQSMVLHAREGSCGEPRR